MGKLQSAFDEVMRNWAAWARDRYKYQHCASIEHRYKSPQDSPTGWGDWENAAPGQIAMPINSLQAVEVQKHIARLGFQFAWALTFEYCYPKYDKWAAARHCKVYRPERLAKLTTKAKHAIANQLQSRKEFAYIRDCTTERARISDALQGIQGRRQGRVFLKEMKISRKEALDALTREAQLLDMGY